MTIPAPTPVAQALLDELWEQTRSLPDKLLRPQDWAQMALCEAHGLLGTPEGAAKLAEAKRYLACCEILERLARRCAQLEAQLGAVRAGERPKDGN